MIINKGKHGKYSLKENPKRFFMPFEWEKFIDAVRFQQKFYFNLLFNTGMRYNEAKSVKVIDIDFRQKWIVVKKAKGGRARIRYSHFTADFKKQLRNFIDVQNLKSEDTFGFPTIQAMIQVLKGTCERVGIRDYKDFSIHNIRKTHENYLLAAGKDMMSITQHIGHNMNIASQHYVSGALIKDPKEKEKIAKWFGGMFE